MKTSMKTSKVELGEAADRVMVSGLPAHLLAKLPPPTRTPEGWWQVWGYAAKANNVQAYPEMMPGLQRQYRPAEEVFDAESLASWLGRPVTILHPREQGAQYTLLSPQTARAHQDGAVFAADADLEALMVRVGVLVTSAEGVAHVESPTGLRELSAGYLRALDPSPGISPGGEPYDAVQRQIRINHVALVPEGRAGKEARLRGATDTKEPQMEYEEITLPNGAVIKVARADAARLRDLVQSASDSASATAALKAENATLKADNATLKVDLLEVQRRVEASAADSLRARVAPLLPGKDLSAQTSAQLRHLVVEAAYPELIGAFDAAQVEAVFEKAAEKIASKVGEQPTKDALKVTDAPSAPKTSAREEYLKKQAAAWQRPAN